MIDFSFLIYFRHITNIKELKEKTDTWSKLKWSDEEMKFHVQQNLVSFFFVFFFPFLFGRKIYRGGIIINAYHSVSDVRIFHVIPSPVDVSSNYACRACSSSSPCNARREWIQIDVSEVIFVAFEYCFKKSRFNHR